MTVVKVSSACFIESEAHKQVMTRQLACYIWQMNTDTMSII